MPFLRAIDDLFIHVSGGVRVFLSRQRQDYASVTFARRWQLVRAIAATTTTARHLYPSPLAPEIDAARCFQSLRDIRAANSRCDFKKIELSIFGALDKFRMRRAVLKT